MVETLHVGGVMGTEERKVPVSLRSRLPMKRFSRSCVGRKLAIGRNSQFFPGLLRLFSTKTLAKDGPLRRRSSGFQCYSLLARRPQGTEVGGGRSARRAHKILRVFLGRVTSYAKLREKANPSGCTGRGRRE